jgi:predicted peptidase
MGGNGAWVYAAQQPRLFAAIAVVCGYAQESTPIARRVVAGQTAVLVCHSADDSVIPVSASDEMVQALTDRGQPARMLKYVRYEHAPGVRPRRWKTHTPGTVAVLALSVAPLDFTSSPPTHRVASRLCHRAADARVCSPRWPRLV